MNKYVFIFDGEELGSAEVSQRLGLTQSALIYRLHRGWSLEEAASRPPRPYSRRDVVQVDFRGRWLTVRDLANEIGMLPRCATDSVASAGTSSARCRSRTDRRRTPSPVNPDPKHIPDKTDADRRRERRERENDRHWEVLRSIRETIRDRWSQIKDRR